MAFVAFVAWWTARAGPASELRWCARARHIVCVAVGMHRHSMFHDFHTHKLPIAHLAPKVGSYSPRDGWAASQSGFVSVPEAREWQVWHFPGHKLRLGGDALGADPTYLLYLPFRSHGAI